MWLFNFLLQAGFAAEGPESGTKFPEINLEEKVRKWEQPATNRLWILVFVQILSFQKMFNLKQHFNL